MSLGATYKGLFDLALSATAYVIRQRACHALLAMKASRVILAPDVVSDESEYPIHVASSVSECDEYFRSRWRDLLSRCGFRPSVDSFGGEFVDRHAVAIASMWDKDRMIGTAGLREVVGQPSTVSLLTFVAVDPLYQGRSLGRHVVAKALGAACEKGVDLCFLLTEDIRLSAIKSYWKCGFRPNLATWDRTHLYRWRRICRRLGVPFEHLTATTDHHVIASIDK